MKQQNQTITSGNQTADKPVKKADKALPKPYLVGTKWAVRVRYHGYDKHLSGFDSAAEAQAAAAELRKAIRTQGQPARKGPTLTPLAEAFAQYGVECLPSRKGAEQETRRINAYLRAARLPVLRVQPAPADRRSDAHRWTVELQHEDGRRIVNSLREHRAQQATHRSETEKMRGVLARMPVDDITPAHVQGLVNVMVQDGYSASTISLERALLRQLFNYASASWNWRIDKRNPAVKLKLPPVDNARMRVLSNAEWQAIQPVLASYGNRYAALGVELLLETAMRASEPLTHALWSHVDWNRCILRLTGGKCGGREVPLSQGALRVLRALRDIVPQSEPRVLPTTYEALKRAWTVACEAAGVRDARLHDLRHTAATRYAIEFQGNGALLKLITGHRTFSQLHRYVNMTTTHAVIAMHGRGFDLADAPAGYAGECAARVSAPALPGGDCHPLALAQPAATAPGYRLPGSAR